MADQTTFSVTQLAPKRERKKRNIGILPMKDIPRSR